MAAQGCNCSDKDPHTSNINPTCALGIAQGRHAIFRALSENLKKAVNIMLAQAKFAYLRDMFHGRPHLDAAWMRFALASITTNVGAAVVHVSQDWWMASSCVYM